MLKKFSVLGLSVLFVFALASIATAGCGSCGAEKAEKAETSAHAEHAGVEKTVEGTLVCLGCSLKKSDKANATCSTTGCSDVLKTEDGHYISFLNNTHSADLLSGKKYHNKKISVTGVYFANANTIDVSKFSVDGKEKSWCGHCSAMDGCAAKM